MNFSKAEFHSSYVTFSVKLLTVQEIWQKGNTRTGVENNI